MAEPIHNLQSRFVTNLWMHNGRHISQPIESRTSVIKVGRTRMLTRGITKIYNSNNPNTKKINTMENKGSKKRCVVLLSELEWATEPSNPIPRDHVLGIRPRICTEMNRRWWLLHSESPFGAYAKPSLRSLPIDQDPSDNVAGTGSVKLNLVMSGFRYRCTPRPPCEVKRTYVAIRRRVRHRWKTNE